MHHAGCMMHHASCMMLCVLCRLNAIVYFRRAFIRWAFIFLINERKQSTGTGIKRDEFPPTNIHDNLSLSPISSGSEDEGWCSSSPPGQRKRTASFPSNGYLFLSIYIYIHINKLIFLSQYFSLRLYHLSLSL